MMRPAVAVLYKVVWSYHMRALAALTDDHRLAEANIDATIKDPKMRLSTLMTEGRNLQISQKIAASYSCQSRNWVEFPQVILRVIVIYMILIQIQLQLIYLKARKC